MNNINQQFSKIVIDVITTNMNELLTFNSKNYSEITSKFLKYKDDYNSKRTIFSKYIKSLEEDEKTEIKKYKNLFTNENSTIKKNSLENEYQKIISSIKAKKFDKIDSFINQTYIYHIYFLLLEEISFDNFVMLKRVNSNFDKLENLFK